MELTKENLKLWLDQHQAISARTLCKEANIAPESIAHLYNAKNRNLTTFLANKLLPVLKKYGWK